MATRLRPLGLDAVWSSPLQRARETARALTTGDGRPTLGIDARLIELSYGRWERRTHAEVASTERDALAAWESGAAAAPPGGESRSALLARVGAFLDERVREGIIAVVAHKEVLRAFAIYLGLSGEARDRLFEVPPGGVVAVARVPGGWSLRCLQPVVQMVS